MKHAGAAALDRLAGLLEEIRARPALQERNPGIFYHKSKAFLHFHEDPAGLFADLRGAAGFERYPVNSNSERRRLLDRIDARIAG